MLYFEGICGLNVYNIGIYYIYYVCMMGFFWVWSCFFFEDCNFMLIKVVYGMGNVIY